MKVFAVIAPEANEKLDQAVRTHFVGQFYVIAPGQYLVAATGLTAKEIGQRIGDKGEVGRCLVVPLENYWGWHRVELWEWANARMQA